MRRRKKTVRNLLVGLLLLLLGVGMLLSPYCVLRWNIWREAPNARTLWWGALPYEVIESSPWFFGLPTLFMRDGDELLSCHMDRYEGEAMLTGVSHTPWPEVGEVEPMPFRSYRSWWACTPSKAGVLDGVVAVNVPADTASAELTITCPDGQVRTAQGERKGEILLFWLPGEPGEFCVTEQAEATEEPPREFLYHAVYKDSNGETLLERDGRMELC